MKKSNKKNKKNIGKEVCPRGSKKPIVIEEKEEDILMTELKGDPDNFKQDVKKEAQKGQVMRILMPIIFFVILGSIVGASTWYYQRVSENNEPQQLEEKIQTPPIVIDDENFEEELLEEEEKEEAVEKPTEAPESSGYTEYTVKEGDTLSGIANANGMASKELADYNNITNPESLQIGQVLRIPN